MTAADVVAVVDALEAREIWFRLDGGWGVDALAGRQTREHGDLDVVVTHGDVGRAEAALAALGFAHDPAVEPGLPARYVLRSPDGRQVDLHPIVRDEAGDGWQELGGGSWGRYPAAGLDGEGVVARRRVACISAELQLSHHTEYALRDADRADVAVLAEVLDRRIPPPFT